MGDLFKALLCSFSILFCVETVKYLHVIPCQHEACVCRENVMSTRLENIFYKFAYNHTHRKNIYV